MACLCCGSDRLSVTPVAWGELAGRWRLAPREVDSPDLRDGLRCLDCGVKLRGTALAAAVMACLDFDGRFEDFLGTPAGGLSHRFPGLPRRPGLDRGELNPAGLAAGPRGLRAGPGAIKGLTFSSGVCRSIR